MKNILSVILCFLIFFQMAGPGICGAGAKPVFADSDSAELNIPDGKQAVYKCSVAYNGEGQTSIKLGTAELIFISPDAMRISGKTFAGTYGTGTYQIKACINPTQEMVTVEVTMPDNVVVRRGLYSLLGGSTIDISSAGKDSVTNASLEYTDIAPNEYKLTTTEPQPVGFAGNVYNIVTSFNDAKTTRNFAWTARKAFIGEDAMAVRYRVSGTSAWMAADAKARAPYGGPRQIRYLGRNQKGRVMY